MLLAGTADCTLPGTVRSTCYFGTMSSTYKSSEFHGWSTIATGPPSFFPNTLVIQDDPYAVHHCSTTGLGMVGAATASYYAQSQYKVFGGVDANTLASWRPEHKEAERQRMLNMEREASPDDKVILNPHRHNIPATVRSASDLSNAE